MFVPYFVSISENVLLSYQAPYNEPVKKITIRTNTHKLSRVLISNIKSLIANTKTNAMPNINMFKDGIVIPQKQPNIKQRHATINIFNPNFSQFLYYNTIIHQYDKNFNYNIYLHKRFFVINCNYSKRSKRGEKMREVSFSTDFIDNYILKSDPYYAMVYIYAYRKKVDGLCPGAEEIASALSMDQDEVMRAEKYWIELGFDIFTESKIPPVSEKSRYTPSEISKFVDKDLELSLLYEEVEKLMKKPLSSNDQQTIFWIYNDLGFSAPIIILIINYAKSIDKCRMRYIEKIAMEWSENGISSFSDAEKYLSNKERKMSYESKIKKMFGIDRNLTSTEKSVILSWCEDIKPTDENLLKAYDICIERTGKFSAKYINAILVNWKSETKNKSKQNVSHQYVPTPKSTKFDNFTGGSGIDYEKFEMEALRKRMSKYRGENND